MLVALGDDEDGRAAWSKEPFVAVGDEEIGIERGEVQRDLADAVGAVNQAEDAFFLADYGQGLKGDADTRHGGDSVKESNTGVLALYAGGGNGCAETRNVVGIGDWVLRRDRAVGNKASRVTNISDGLVARTIDGAEAQDLVFAVLVPRDVAENSVNCCSCVGDEDAVVYWGIDKGSNGGAGLVQIAIVGVADKGIWATLLLVLEVVGYLPDCARIASIGSWGDDEPLVPFESSSTYHGSGSCTQGQR